MFHPADCPSWDYKKHPDKDEVLSDVTSTVLVRLREGTLQANTVAEDTRPFHRRLFEQLTPDGYEYYAGHYRGADFRCLRYYKVIAGGDPQVGSPPERVWEDMQRFTDFVTNGIDATDGTYRLSDDQLSEDEKLLNLIRLVAQVFVDFLTVHPYYDGNGHIGRLLVWGILLRYGYRPQGWPVHPRPDDPNYGPMIAQHRRNNPEPLERALVRHVLLGEE